MLGVCLESSLSYYLPKNQKRYKKHNRENSPFAKNSLHTIPLVIKHSQILTQEGLNSPNLDYFNA